jgi:hypothetical protein
MHGICRHRTKTDIQNVTIHESECETEGFRYPLYVWRPGGLY